MVSKSYRDLIAWQKSMDLVEMIYTITQTFPKEEFYGLTSQVRRAAVSIPANIAEGEVRSSRKESAMIGDWISLTADHWRLTTGKGLGRILIILLVIIGLGACGSKGGMGGVLTSSDVLVIQHHLRQHYSCLEEFCRRLYLKNPKYEPNAKKRVDKLDAIFRKQKNLGTPYDNQASHEVLTAAFSTDPVYGDRVALLALGLRKSIDEGYGQHGLDESMITSLQIPLERLKRLYSNINQVNWRLKVYRNRNQELYFLTNEVAPEGHLNMGYEVLMTKILTRIEDDIYMRGGNPPNVIFRMSTMFFTLFL